MQQKKDCSLHKGDRITMKEPGPGGHWPDIEWGIAIT